MSTGVPVLRDWMWTASPMASADSSGCWARWLPITVKWLVWRVLSWMTPTGCAFAWAGRRGWVFPVIRDWACGRTLGFCVSIGKPSSSSVVRPSHWDCRPGGGRRMSAVVWLPRWCGAALSVEQATRPEAN
jgi:hypothetical protein